MDGTSSMGSVTTTSHPQPEYWSMRLQAGPELVSSSRRRAGRWTAAISTTESRGYMTSRMDKSAAPEFHSSSWAFRPWSGVDIEAVSANGRIAFGIPGEIFPQQLDVAVDPGRALEALQGCHLPLVGDVAVVAEVGLRRWGSLVKIRPSRAARAMTWFRVRRPARYSCRCLDHLSIHHSMMEAVVVDGILGSGVP